MHKIYKINGFQIIGDYTLKIFFDDGICKIIDFKAILIGKPFNKLKELSVFNQVKLDTEIHNLVWPFDLDFDPETLHDWEFYKDDFVHKTLELMNI